MSHAQLIMLCILLVVLILVAAFFSLAETGLMAINRYRLRHKARMKKQSAILILRLLKRPDRLLGVILIGNCFSNIMASAIATLLAVHLLGDTGIIISTFLLTFVVLIFAEVAPKTLAALYPERISKAVAWPLFILLKLLYPIVWSINGVSNGLLRLFRINVTSHNTEQLSREELRSVVYETSGRLSRHYQNMLLSILDLNKVTVTDVMVPQHEIVGIDLDLEWSQVQQVICSSTHDWLPIYRDNVNQVIGMLHLRELMHIVLSNQAMNKDLILKLMREPYFVPEGTPLNTQLHNFQRHNKRTALVVDEYGEILGLLTLADILEEIVGEFASNVSNTTKIIQVQKDGSYLVDGSITLREFNRITEWNLPSQGQRTLNGLIVEYLESIPHAGTCVRINNYPIEIMQVQDNRVKVAHVFPRLLPEESEML